MKSSNYAQLYQLVIFATLVYPGPTNTRRRGPKRNLGKTQPISISFQQTRCTRLNSKCVPVLDGQWPFRRLTLSEELPLPPFSLGTTLTSAHQALVA